MSHRQSPWRMYDPANPRRGKNIEQSKFELFRHLILDLCNQGKTYDYIVQHFSRNESALREGFKPTWVRLARLRLSRGSNCVLMLNRRSQVIKWVNRWISAGQPTSPMAEPSSSSPDPALTTPELSQTAALISDPLEAHFGAADDSVNFNAVPANAMPGGKTLPDSMVAIPSAFQQHLDIVNDLGKVEPGIHRATPDHVSSGKFDSLRTNPSKLPARPWLWKNEQSLGGDQDTAHNTAMSGFDTLPLASFRPETPPLALTRSPKSSMSLDQRSFLETSRRAKRALGNQNPNTSSITFSLSGPSVNSGRRSSRSGRWSTGSEKHLWNAARSMSSMSLDPTDSNYHKRAVHLFQTQDIRQPLRYLLGFSEVAAEFVKSRSHGLRDCELFATRNPGVFMEDPVRFCHAAALAQSCNQRTLARHCFDCYNLVRAYHQLAQWAFRNFMHDIVAMDAGLGESSEAQSKINQTFLTSRQDGLKQLREDLSTTSWSPSRHAPDLSWDKMPVPVTYDQFAQRWGMVTAASTG